MKQTRLVVGLLMAAASSTAGCSATPATLRHPTSTTGPVPTVAGPTVAEPTVAGPTTTTAAAVTETLSAIAFFTPTTGYGLVEKQEGTACHDLVGHTRDGGADFGSLVEVAAWDCNDDPVATALAFDDVGDGFLYEPDLFVTHDGGTTWSASSQPGAVLAVAALGPSVWMVEADCPVPVAPLSGCPLRLLESTDGGRSWNPSPSEPPGAMVPDNGAGLAEEPAQSQTWLVRISQSSAFVVSNPGHDSDAPSDEAPLWFTDDGGASWAQRQIPCGSGFTAGSVVLSAAPDGALMAVCAGEPSTGYEAKSSALSVDGGVTWAVHFPCPAPNTPQTPGCATAPFNSGYTREIDAVSGDTAFLVGGRSPLMVTDDGGIQWQPVEAVGGDDAGTDQVIFFNTSDGVVLGERDGETDDVPTLWSTTDGGTRWSAVVPEFG